MPYRNIYIKAAKDIASERKEYSCNAICNDKGDIHWPARMRYVATMDPHTNKIFRACGLRDMWQPTPPKVIDFRVWLLCMMAACSDDMERIVKDNHE